MGVAGKDQRSYRTWEGQCFQIRLRRERPHPHSICYWLKKTLMKFMTIQHHCTQPHAHRGHRWRQDNSLLFLFTHWSLIWSNYQSLICGLTTVFLCWTVSGRWFHSHKCSPASPDHFLVPSFYMYGFLGPRPPRFTHGHVNFSTRPRSLRPIYWT